MARFALLSPCSTYSHRMLVAKQAMPTDAEAAVPSENVKTSTSDVNLTHVHPQDLLTDAAAVGCRSRCRSRCHCRCRPLLPHPGAVGRS